MDFFRSWLIPASLIAVGVLSGCTPSLPELNVEDQWKAAMERQALYAIFPITEDLMIGDVLLDTREVRGVAQDGFRVVRIARTERKKVLDVLCQDRNKRITIAPMRPGGPIEQNAKAKADEQATRRAADEFPYYKCPPEVASTEKPSRPESAFRDGFPNPSPGVVLIGSADAENADLRLSRSDIPETTVARLTVAQLGGGGVFGNVAANLGIGASNRVALTIKLNDLQSLQIEPTVAQQMLPDLIRLPTAEDPGPVLGVMAQQWPEGGKRMCKGDFAGAKAMRVSIVTRVDYAGGITYEFTEGQETALRLALSLASLGGGTPQTPTILPLPNPPQITAGGGDTGKPETVGKSETAATIGADALAKRLDAVLRGVTGAPGTNPTMGVTASLGIGNSGRLALQSKYARPMAVGAGTTLRYPPEAALLVTKDDWKQDIAGALDICATILDVPFTAKRDGDWCEPGAEGYLTGEATVLNKLRVYLCDKNTYAQS